MKRPRPYIPMSVRVQVAERQVEQSGSILWPIYLARVAQSERLGPPWSATGRLRTLLKDLFADDPVQLDHDPALILRPYNPRIKKVAARYTPNANDPAALKYSRKADHQEKTTGRKPGALRTVTTKGSDIWVKTKFDRLEGRTKKRLKQKIRSRGFQKGKRTFGHGYR